MARVIRAVENGQMFEAFDILLILAISIGVGLLASVIIKSYGIK